MGTSDMKTSRMTGAEAVVRVLEGQGVANVFGICGHTVIGVLDALGRSKVRFVSVHHEGVTSHAADGLARRTGKAGVVLVHLGPGLTNTITGIAQNPYSPSAQNPMPPTTAPISRIMSTSMIFAPARAQNDAATSGSTAR